METYYQQTVDSLQATEAAHTLEAAQTWCQKNLPNFIPKDDWVWSVRWRGKVYKDVAQKRLDKLRWRLHFAWKNVT